ncbi:carbonic anhydrase family protein [Mesorhizobium sp. LHD-90]|uniref:carbonic anhydrase family protein n=1 Tax=Mesorhizobium sp. LHD-90 TaxID=3071414 RepID=UPI0027E05962|nr:carbonic anhydrase family protein [Mesorhizobium sp. LHD-90]MDQ6436440.1 carbonic anhydrase family protein [Mesorhizobium sp. LHD-90]
MLTRRLFCGCLPLAATIVASNAFAAAPDCAVFTPERRNAVSPAEAIERLKAGNQRFVSGATINCDLMAQVKETAHAQAPFAAILGCIDSRVPPELVFDQRIGDVFCARIAGNFVDTDILGSFEFATKVAGARAIVVLGHSSCGAIKGAVDDVKLGNLTAMLANIRPAADAVKTDAERTSANHDFVQAVAEENVRRAVAQLTERSEVLAALVEAGELRIAGAMHDLATGKVTFLA